MDRSALADSPAPSSPVRAGPTARLAILAFTLAQVARTLGDENTQDRLDWYASLMGLFLALYILTQWRAPTVPAVQHAYLAFQSALVLAMLAPGQTDSVTTFFLALSFQAAQFSSPPTLWIWIGGMVLLTTGSLTLLFGPLEGLALAMSPAAGIIAIPAFMLVNHQTETARKRSQTLLAELETARRHLQSYAGQVEELAALKERHRLARQLHDTVSQFVFSIALTSRSARVLLDEDPPRVAELLGRLQAMTTNALSQLRSLITQMRP
jgi:signal transduction histidine kinase